MSFEIIDTGSRQSPPRIVTYGRHGIGKSSFGASAPSPIFIPTEDGLNGIKTKSFKLCKTYDEVMGCIEHLYESDHEFQTVVLDSLDWLESLAHAHVCENVPHEKGKKIESIEDYGFGKGYIHAASYIKTVLEGLDALRDKKNMAIILTAHAQVTRFDDPMSTPYDQYRIKLHKNAAALVEEWADAVLFATIDTFTKEDETGFNKTRTRAFGDERVLKTSVHPAYAAKNRYGLPPSIPMSWQALEAAIVSESETQTTETKEG